MNHLWPSDKYIPRHLRRQGVISRPGRWKACRHTGSRARRSWTACSRRTGPACRKGEACPRTAEIALMFSPWARLSVATVCLSEYGLAPSKPVRPTKRSHSFLKVLYDLVQTSSATTGRPSSDLIPISRGLSPFSSMATRARNRPPWNGPPDRNPRSGPASTGTTLRQIVDWVQHHAKYHAVETRYLKRVGRILAEGKRETRRCLQQTPTNRTHSQAPAMKDRCLRISTGHREHRQ